MRPEPWRAIASGGEKRAYADRMIVREAHNQRWRRCSPWACWRRGRVKFARRIGNKCDHLHPPHKRTILHNNKGNCETTTTTTNSTAANININISKNNKVDRRQRTLPSRIVPSARLLGPSPIGWPSATRRRQRRQSPPSLMSPRTDLWPARRRRAARTGFSPLSLPASSLPAMPIDVYVGRRRLLPRPLRRPHLTRAISQSDIYL